MNTTIIVIIPEIYYSTYIMGYYVQKRRTSKNKYKFLGENMLLSAFKLHKFQPKDNLNGITKHNTRNEIIFRKEKPCLYLFYIETKSTDIFYSWKYLKHQSSKIDIGDSEIEKGARLNRFEHGWLSGLWPSPRRKINSCFPAFIQES